MRENERLLLNIVHVDESEYNLLMLTERLRIEEEREQAGRHWAEMTVVVDRNVRIKVDGEDGRKWDCFFGFF